MVIEGWRAWRAWTERSVSVWSHERGLVRQGGSHLEKAVEEGDVVGPFLQGGVEQSKGSVDARGILAEALVLGRRVFCVHGIAGQPGPSSIGSTVHALPPPPPPRPTLAQLVPPLPRDRRFTTRALWRYRATARFKRHGWWADRTRRGSPWWPCRCSSLLVLGRFSVGGGRRVGVVKESGSGQVEVVVTGARQGVGLPCSVLQCGVAASRIEAHWSRGFDTH